MSTSNALTKNDLEAVIGKLVSNRDDEIQSKVDKSGDTMTGVLNDLTFSTPNIAGFQTDEFGNFVHKRDTVDDSWQIRNHAETPTLLHAWETGDLTITGDFKSNRDVIMSSVSGKKINANAQTEMTRITLPAGRKYIILAQAGVGALDQWPSPAWGTSTGYHAAGLTQVSGTANYSLLGGSPKAPVYSGGGVSLVGYIYTSTACVVALLQYMYGSSTNSGAWAHLVAVPL